MERSDENGVACGPCVLPEGIRLPNCSWGGQTGFFWNVDGWCPRSPSGGGELRGQDGLAALACDVLGGAVEPGSTQQLAAGQCSDGDGARPLGRFTTPNPSRVRNGLHICHIYVIECCMQMHCYVPDVVADVIRKRAEGRGMSVSRYLAELVQREIGGGWPEGYFETVVGKWQGGMLKRAAQGRLETRARF